MNICIIAHKSLGALINKGDGHIGGIEMQMAQFSKWLADRGHIVHLVTWDYDFDTDYQYPNLSILKICKQTDGIPGFRFLHPRWTSLASALRKANSDIYFHNGAENVTGQIAYWCKRNNKKFVFSAAAATDTIGELPLLNNLRDRTLYRYGLNSADQIIVQTNDQRRSLKRDFKLESEVHPMPCNYPVSPQQCLPPPNQPTVLWVGRLHPVKRLEWLLDIAKSLTHINFDIVGPKYYGNYSEDLVSEIEKIDNAKYHGPLSSGDLIKFYRNSTCLCCTSESEGFPNTFLEAWSQGLPVISTLDIDEHFSSGLLGLHGESKQQLAKHIETLADSPNARTEISSNCISYYEKHHQLDNATMKFESTLLSLI